MLHRIAFKNTERALDELSCAINTVFSDHVALTNYNYLSSLENNKAQHDHQ